MTGGFELDGELLEDEVGLLDDGVVLLLGEELSEGELDELPLGTSELEDGTSELELSELEDGDSDEDDSKVDITLRGKLSGYHQS